MNSDYHEHMPEIEVLQESINFFKSLDLSSKTTFEISELLNKHFPIQVFSVGVKWDDRFHLYRVRRNLSNSFEPWKNICQIGLPPADVTPLGRANIENSPLFYASHSEDLCFFEANQNITKPERWIPQNFTLSIWKVSKNQVLNLVPIIHSKTVQEKRADIKSYFDQSKSENLISESNEKLNQSFDLLSEFFADEFSKVKTNGNDDYKISASYANLIMELNSQHNLGIDGILYPSVVDNYLADNVALFPNSLKKIELLKSCLATSYNFDFNKRTMTKGILKTGIIGEAGEIIWKNE